MRKLLAALALTFAMVCFSWSGLGGQDFQVEKHEVKARHKAERQALKLKEKYVKESWKDQEIPKAERIRMKHQMERERRELRQRQKDELQDLKDHQRVLKESQERL